MKIEDQVCSLELAKKLKELGIKQISIFYYDGKDNLFFSELPSKDNLKLPYISAFTVAELGEMLPMNIKITTIGENELAGFHYNYTQNCNDYSICFYAKNNGQTRIYTKEAKTEADARAKMLIYLLENKIITVEEVNERLVK